MKIEISSVIVRAKRRLGLMNTTRWDAELEALIQEGAIHLNALSTYAISHETIDVDCTKAKLPDGVTEVLAIRNPNLSTCVGFCCVVPDEFSVDNRLMQTNCNCGNYFVADRGLLTAFDGDCSYGGNIYAVQNGYISLPTNTTLTEIKVWYRGYNKDCDGIMLLDEIQERGLSAYAAFQFALSGTHISKYTPMQVREWRQEWNNQKGFVQGKASQDDFRQNKPTVAAIAQAILLSPYQALKTNI